VVAIDLAEFVIIIFGGLLFYFSGYLFLLIAQTRRW